MKEDLFRFINTDIHIEILSQLSVSDLQSLKCVSKKWNSIISDSLFVRCQMKKIETVAGFFFQEKFQWCDDIERISYIPLRSRNSAVCTTVLNFLPERVVMLSSCNGLICCRCCFPSLSPVIYVCNPINKNWVSIKWSSRSKMDNIALTFEPLKISASEALTNFKLVSVSKSEAETETEEKDYFIFQVFFSKTGQRRRSEEMCKCKHNLFKNKGVFADGSLFWLTDGYQIIMFDPLLELSYLINMPLPSTQFCTTPEMCIGVSNGKLHCVLLSENGIQLWVLLDHFESLWDLTFSISLDDLENENPEFLYNLADKLSNQGRNGMLPWFDLLAFSDGILFTKSGYKCLLL